MLTSTSMPEPFVVPAAELEALAGDYTAAKAFFAAKAVCWPWAVKSVSRTPVYSL
jgi:hypothetical protein